MDVVAAVATHFATVVVRVAAVVTCVQLIFLTIVITCRPPLGDTGVTPEDQIKRDKFFRIFGDHVINLFDFDFV